MTHQSSILRLLALPDYFRITDVQTDGGEPAPELTLSVISTRRFACCPLCQRPSRRVHSHYLRTLADLPCAGQALLLNVTVRRFFCGNRQCPRRVFAERLPELTQPYARRTRRQRDKLQDIGVANGGRAGARLAARRWSLCGLFPWLDGTASAGYGAALASTASHIGSCRHSLCGCCAALSFGSGISPDPMDGHSKANMCMP